MLQKIWDIIKDTATGVAFIALCVLTTTLTVVALFTILYYTVGFVMYLGVMVKPFVASVFEYTGIATFFGKIGFPPGTNPIVLSIFAIGSICALGYAFGSELRAGRFFPQMWEAILVLLRLREPRPVYTPVIEGDGFKPNPRPAAEELTISPEMEKMIDGFATALKQKLALADQKYGYRDDWSYDDWEQECRAELLRHIQKGDPRDVAAYCAFMWHHGWSTNAPTDTEQKTGEA